MAHFSISLAMVIAVTPFVADHTNVSVSSLHGLWLSGSAYPPQRSISRSPWWYTENDPPLSVPSSTNFLQENQKINSRSERQISTKGSKTMFDINHNTYCSVFAFNTVAKKTKRVELYILKIKVLNCSC